MNKFGKLETKTPLSLNYIIQNLPTHISQVFVIENTFFFLIYADFLATHIKTDYNQHIIHNIIHTLTNTQIVQSKFQTKYPNQIKRKPCWIACPPLTPTPPPTIHLSSLTLNNDLLQNNIKILHIM